MSKHQHPDWVAPRKTVRVIRTGFRGRIDAEYTHVVERQTPTTVIMENGAKFKLIEGQYIERPAYLDYTTRLETGEGTCSACGANIEYISRHVGWVDALSGDDGGTYDKCPSGGPHTVEHTGSEG